MMENLSYKVWNEYPNQEEEFMFVPITFLAYTIIQVVLLNLLSRVMVDRDARIKRVGGEYICKVW
jgi:ribosomal protein S8